jgi:hypothetical protein
LKLREKSREREREREREDVMLVERIRAKGYFEIDGKA